MATVYAVTNEKGGVAKTTTTANLGASFAMEGKRVLALELDLQMNLTKCLGVKLPKTYKSTYDILHGDPIREAIVKTEFGIDLIPASRDLSAFESDVADCINKDMDHAKFLRDALQGSGILDEYDIVLIDFPPSLGTIPLNGLAAADEVLIPVQAEPLATDGVHQLLKTVADVKAKVNPELAIGGAFMTMYDGRQIGCRDVKKASEQYFKSRGIRFLKTVIKTCVKFKDAPGYGVPAVVFYPNENKVQDYRRLAREVCMA